MTDALKVIERGREHLREVAATLAAAGVPADVLLEDVRADVADAVTAHGRSGR